MVVVMMVTVMLLRKSGARNEHDQGEQQCFFHVPMITTTVVGGFRNFCVTPHHSCRLHVMWDSVGESISQPFPQISVGT